MLTGVGLVGILVDFGAFFAIHGPLTGGGCGGLAGLGVLLMLVAAVLVLVYCGLIATLVVSGLVFSWRRSRWGPRLLIPANLLSMAFFYWSPVDPGQLTWATVLVLFSAAPAIAVVLSVWALLSPASLGIRVGELGVLGTIAFVLLSAYVYGINADITAGMAPPPQLVARAGCGPAATIMAP
jgi:hypothetical protein